MPPCAIARPEDDVVLDRAAVADPHALVHDHVRPEGHILADLNVLPEHQPGCARALRQPHRRTTLGRCDERVTPRRSTTRRARLAMRSWSTLGWAVTITARSASLTASSRGVLESPKSVSTEIGRAPSR